MRSELEKLGIVHKAVELGEAEVDGITDEQYERLSAALLGSGLELIDNKRAMLIERIKGLIVEMVHYEDELPRTKNSGYISGKLHYDYTYLSNLFSEATGSTIEQFIIMHKIERVKELIIYDELNLTEIASKLNYSSVSHLSNQFKKITGLTPSFFKSLKNNRRNTLENM